MLGLSDPLDRLIPYPPVYVRTVLLPFGDRIVVDGLIAVYNISLGPGIRLGLLAQWRDISERRVLQTSLLVDPEKERSQASAAREGTNKDVLRAFSRHLRKLGLSDRIAARDEQTAGALATAISDRSVRECDIEDLEALLDAAPRAAQAELRTGLNRFVQFLRDTNRMDWAEAEEMRRMLRAR